MAHATSHSAGTATCDAPNQVVFVSTRNSSFAPSPATSTSISSPFAKSPDQDLLRERIFDVLLDRPLERPRAEVLVVAVRAQELGRRVGELEVISSSPSRFCTSLIRIETICAMCSFDERVEHDHVVEPVQELRVEHALDLLLHLLLNPLEVLASSSGVVKPSAFPFVMSRAPTFDVMITTVFLKSMTRP